MPNIFGALENPNNWPQIPQFCHKNSSIRIVPKKEKISWRIGSLETAIKLRLISETIGIFSKSCAQGLISSSTRSFLKEAGRSFVVATLVFPVAQEILIYQRHMNFPAAEELSRSLSDKLLVLCRKKRTSWDLQIRYWDSFKNQFQAHSEFLTRSLWVDSDPQPLAGSFG